MNDMPTFRAEVTRDGRWYMVKVPGIGLTQARNPREVERMARDLIAISINLDVTYLDQPYSDEWADD